MCMQMFILDGNLYDTKFLEGVKADGSSELEEDAEGYMLLLNKKKVRPSHADGERCDGL
jgi:hypothetical protein